MRHGVSIRTRCAPPPATRRSTSYPFRAACSACSKADGKSPSSARRELRSVAQAPGPLQRRVAGLFADEAFAAPCPERFAEADGGAARPETAHRQPVERL